jgi:catechol 2,3-dioxygenase-like lactoylglutathione lyase family enzyme
MGPKIVHHDSGAMADLQERNGNIWERFMPVTLNHTIVHAHDPAATAEFYANVLNLPPARALGHFTVLQVGETSLDMLQTDEAIPTSHYAFLTSEAEFDDVMGRIHARSLPYWADPFHKVPGEINRWDDGRGVYFDDPNGHVLEVITRPYGSGGPHAAHPNPLLPSKE